MYRKIIEYVIPGRCLIETNRPLYGENRYSGLIICCGIIMMNMMVYETWAVTFDRTKFSRRTKCDNELFGLGVYHNVLRC